MIIDLFFIVVGAFTLGELHCAERRKMSRYWFVAGFCLVAGLVDLCHRVGLFHFS
jgi:hypothetical protein